MRTVSGTGSVVDEIGERAREKWPLYVVLYAVAGVQLQVSLAMLRMRVSGSASFSEVASPSELVPAYVVYIKWFTSRG